MKSLDFLRLIWSIIIGVWVFSDGIDFWTIAGAGVIFSSGPYLLIRNPGFKDKHLLNQF